MRSRFIVTEITTRCIVRPYPVNHAPECRAGRQDGLLCTAKEIECRPFGRSLVRHRMMERAGEVFEQFKGGLWLIGLEKRGRD